MTRSAAIPSLRDIHPRPVGDDDWFVDRAADLGVRHAYRDGSEAGLYQLLESVGGGVASFDFDRDGREDLLFTGGGSLREAGDAGSIEVLGRPSRLFRNQSSDGFADVSESARTQDDQWYTHGCTICDVDADGLSDLVIAAFGGLKVWQNQGDGTFQSVAADLGLESGAWNVMAAAGDFDGDGLSDLYVLTYADWQPDPDRLCQNDQGLRDICGPTLFPGARDRLFQNTGEGFVDVTDQAGLVAGNRGLGVVTADVNLDGRIDIAVVNDVQENQLYLNGPDGVLRDEALLWGAAYSSTGEREGSMGIEAGDFDRDGLPDLWYTNYAQQDNSLLRNIGAGGFASVGTAFGLAGVSRSWVGFGTVLADFDGDGWDDIFISNGHVAYERRDSPYFQPPQLFQSEAGRRFVDVSSRGGSYFDLTWSGRGAARIDWDNDGAWDLAVTHQNDPVALLHNRQTPASWITLDLVGTSGNRDAVGAAVLLDDGEHATRRWRVGGGSYLSHNDRRLMFALQDPATETADIVVEWPGGDVERFQRLKTRQTHVLIEGRGTRVAP